MNRRIMEYSEMESVLLRLQCVYETLMMIHGQTYSKPLYCAADELMHITDEFGDFLSASAPVPEKEKP